ncbi:DNA adenine methylase [Lactovum odontotermitis]
MKPILKYPGGKRLEIKHFAHLIPPHHTYIEPFLGGGAVFFYLEPKRAIVNDLNTPLMRFYREIQAYYPQIEKELKKLHQIWEKNKEQFLTISCQDDPNERFYYQMREDFNQQNFSYYSFATIFYALNKLSFSAVRFNAKGENNVPYGHRASFAQVLHQGHQELLQQAQIENIDYAEIFKQAKADDFIFLDPPYDTRFTNYGNTVDFKEDEQRRLAEDFKNLGAKALLIIGETQLTDELYGKYLFGAYEKRYAHRSGKQGENLKKTNTHLIVSNYLNRRT